jgi:hypothetical protein
MTLFETTIRIVQQIAFGSILIFQMDAVAQGQTEPVAESAEQPSQSNLTQPPEGPPDVLNDSKMGSSSREVKTQPDHAQDLSPTELLEKAKKLYDALEYDEVVPITERLIAAPQLSIEQRLDGYLLQGSSLAIVGNPIDAEKPFRFLLRGRPDFDLPPDTPPKILAVFRKVQVEENAIRRQMEELQRKRTIETLDIESAPLGDLIGGQPIHFSYRLIDPRGAVGAVQVFYRRIGTKDFSSLALEMKKGRWIGRISGEWTANDKGFIIQYIVETSDNKGPLRALGSKERPLEQHVKPGKGLKVTPYYKSYWFWGLGGTAAAVFLLSTVTTMGVVAYIITQPTPSELGTHCIDCPSISP